MAESRDPLTAWQDAVSQLWSSARALTGPSAEAIRPLLAPLQRQTELLQETVRRQATFESQLVRRMLGPFDSAVGSLEQTSTAMRAQAQAFEAAATSFSQAARLLSRQAELVEGAAKSLRDPLEFLRTTGSGLTGPFGAAAAPEPAEAPDAAAETPASEEA